MKASTLTLVVTAVCLLASATVQAAVITSTFDHSNEGWTVVDCNYITDLHNPPVINANYTANYDSAGYIYKTDPNLVDTYLFSAPAKFLGYRDYFFGKTIEWDLYDYSNGHTDTGLILVGGGKTLYRLNVTPPLDDQWTHYSFTLASETDWVLNSPTGPLATDADFHSVLSSLSAIYIMGDWLAGSDMASLDNVILTPEPASMTLLAVGAMALLRRRRSRLAA